MTTMRDHSLFPLLVVFGACTTGDAAPPDAPRPVRTAGVADTTLPSTLDVAGVLSARDETDLGFTSGGVVASVTVRAGARVRRGEVLATLDLAAIAAAETEARAAVTKAARDLARAERLLADSVVPAVVVQDAGTALDAARARLEAAAFARRTGVITAPADGVVLARLAEPGRVVAPGAAVLRFGRTAGGLLFRAGVSEAAAVALRVGDSATVMLSAMANRTWRARIETVAAAPTPGSATWAVELRLLDAPALPTGLTGRATISTGGPIAARVVPIAAIAEADDSLGTVFVMRDGVAARQLVVLGPMRNGIAVVRRGLDAGARVITDGATLVTDGEPVREGAP
jgi:RND family efflux transporter MFP subunit